MTYLLPIWLLPRRKTRAAYFRAYYWRHAATRRPYLAAKKREYRALARCANTAANQIS